MADELSPTRQWGQWRGPLATGVAPEANPPTTWSESEHVKWKYAIPGYGTSVPVIWGDQVFITTAVETGKKDASAAKPVNAAAVPQFVQAPPANPTTPGAGDTGGEARRGRGPGGPGGAGGGGRMRSEKPDQVHQFIVICVDRVTGKERWKKVAREQLPHEGHHGDHGFASGSCVTDGKHVFAFFGSRGIYCYDLEGNLKWEKDLGDMQTRAGFGEGASPALQGDTLVINWDHEGDDFIAAFNKNDGKEIWRKPRSEATTWTTPLIVTHEGKAQVIVTATERTRSYDLKTGETLWECGGMTANVIPTPVSGFGMLYAISGFRGAMLQAIKLGKTGDLSDTDAIAWKHEKRTPYVPSPLLDGDRLYFYSGNDAQFSCLDAKTGKVIIEAERIPGLGGVYASPVSAQNKIYLAGREGTTVVLKKGDKVEVLATNKLDDKFDASPALVQGNIFLRGHKYLYCLGE
jgi:outer membrane protein assembly factor BamB